MRVLILIILFVLHSPSSHAALGGAPSDLEVKNSTRKAQSLASVAHQNYRVNDSILSSGTMVHEYISSRNVVFAVSWNGPFLPDLQTLLGKYFDTMVAEAGKQPRAGRSQLRVSRPDVSIFSGGHMRAYEGRAWVVSEFPAGFNVSDIQ